jgi:hypothetical protein
MADRNRDATSGVQRADGMLARGYAAVMGSIQVVRIDVFESSRRSRRRTGSSNGSGPLSVVADDRSGAAATRKTLDERFRVT